VDLFFEIFFSLQDFEYGRLLACMGDKEGARVQFDLVMSGKLLEVNSAGRKVRIVVRISCTAADDFFFPVWMDALPFCAGQVQFRGTVLIPSLLSVPADDLFNDDFEKNELHLRSNAALEALNVDKRL
jgi:hypothetical protein